ncbi:hypothetical protein [Arcanobacterium hippocoleae]
MPNSITLMPLSPMTAAPVFERFPGGFGGAGGVGGVGGGAIGSGWIE